MNVVVIANLSTEPAPPGVEAAGADHRLSQVQGAERVHVRRRVIQRGNDEMGAFTGLDAERSILASDRATAVASGDEAGSGRRMPFGLPVVPELYSCRMPLLRSSGGVARSPAD